MWVLAEHVGNDKKQQIKFHWPYVQLHMLYIYLCMYQLELEVFDSVKTFARLLHS